MGICRPGNRQACGVACLALGANTIVLLFGSILFGLGIGNLVSLPPLIAQQEFTRDDVPRVVALVTAVNQAVFAFAPLIFGLLREMSDGYALPFMVAVAFQLLAGIVVVSAGRHRSTRITVIATRPPARYDRS
jgi:cyanate permease